jgi:hypothetical protein
VESNSILEFKILSRNEHRAQTGAVKCVGRPSTMDLLRLPPATPEVRLVTRWLPPGQTDWLLVWCGIVGIGPTALEAPALVGLSGLYSQPFVFGRNSKCQPVREWTPERNFIAHMHARFKRASMRTSGILECNIGSKNAQHTLIEKTQCAWKLSR